MGDRKLAAAFYCAAVMLQGCSPPTTGGGTSVTPPEPVLNAVLLPGQHITFARLIADRTYEALPSASVILRLTSKWPLDGERVRVTLAPVSPPPQPGPLAWVRSDDLPRKQQLANTGYFETIVDGFGYSVVVTPAPSLQTSNGFNLVVTTTAGGTANQPAAESAPIIVTIRPRAARTLPSAVFFDCDASGRGPGNWYNTCKNSSSIVARDVVLQGWLRGPSPNAFGGNNDPIWIEDWHYDFDLDPDFIEQMYGPQGAFLALSDGTLTAPTTVLRGNLPGGPGMQLVDRAAGTGQPIGITVNSFLQPDNRANLDDQVNSEAALKAELNAWHENNQGSPRCVQFFQQCRHWIGRGAPPAGWIRLTAADYTPWSVDPDAPANTFWPYDPRLSLVGTSPLVPDDYVRVAGTLWQDTDHGGGVGRWTKLRPAMGGWLELHSVDWIARVPGPAVRKLVRIVERINWDAVNDLAETRTLEPASRPDASHVLRCRELVDGRFTWPASIVQHSATVNATNVVVQTTVRRAVMLPGLPGLQPGRFKASYILWWEPGQPETACRQG